MARYSDASREQVREAIDFVDVVSARTELKRAGVRRYTGLCPFHEERSPSFGIDPVEKLYHCFGCGEGGDVFKFVMETEGLDFGAALESLAQRAGIELERTEEDPRSAQRRQRRERLQALLERTTGYFVRVLWEADEALEAREYLLGRGLEEASLREFRVGYAPSGWDKVLLASRRAGFSEEELRAAGLVQRSREGKVYDAFRGRITFPLCDRRGNVLGFGARAMRDGQGPKYVNTREGELFTKGQMVYGYDLARAAASKAGAVILAEGYTDVIALRQVGVAQSVGLMGTALTDRQARELKGLGQRVILCLDADAAGEKAMVRAAGLVSALGCEVRVMVLPDGADPADVALRDGGTEAVRAALEGAVPFARFQVERALSRSQATTAEGRDETLKAVAEVLRPLAPSILRDELVGLTAGRLRLSESLAASVLGSAASEEDRAQLAAVLDRTDATERAFLVSCVAMPAEGAARLADLDIDAIFTSPLARRAAAHVRDHAEALAIGLPDGDDELASFVAELRLRADDAEPSAASLVVEALQLELGRLDREITGARVRGDAVHDLALARQRVRDEIRHRVH